MAEAVILLIPVVREFMVVCAICIYAAVIERGRGTGAYA